MRRYFECVNHWKLLLLLGLLLGLLSLGACGDMSLAQIKSNLNHQLSTTLINKTTGGDFLFPIRGMAFQPVQPVDARDAIIYVYRPLSAWNRDEVETPSFFVNGQRVYGLKGGGYFWLELAAGDYYFMAKRAFSIFNFKTIFDVHFRVEGAKAYYFRYDENNLAPEDYKPDPLVPLLWEGPLQQKTYGQAMLEIKKTVLEDSADYVDHDRELVWKPFDLYPMDHDVSKGQLQILDPDHGIHQRYTPVLHADTSELQNSVDNSTRWMPDWMKHFFR